MGRREVTTVHQVSGGRLVRASLWFGAVALVLAATVSAGQEDEDICATGSAGGAPHSLQTYPFNSC